MERTQGRLLARPAGSWDPPPSRLGRRDPATNLLRKCEAGPPAAHAQDGFWRDQHWAADWWEPENQAGLHPDASPTGDCETFTVTEKFICYLTGHADSKAGVKLSVQGWEVNIFRLWALWSLLQLLHSAVVARKQPQAICK